MRPLQAFCVLALLILSACAGNGMPTSERLEAVKRQKETAYKRQVAAAGLQYGSPAFIRIFKEEAALELWLKEEDAPSYRLYKTYPVCNFSGTLGPKLKEGDRQAPEGFYTVGVSQMNPWSRHHLSFNLGFPNTYDAALGRTGSALMIHGGCDSIGCYAVTDEQVEEIYLITEASIAKGANVPVHIFPFRMHEPNMFMHQNDPWMPFWMNLKQGHDLFEATKIPPAYGVDMSAGTPSYVFQVIQPVVPDTQNDAPSLWSPPMDWMQIPAF